MESVAKFASWGTVVMVVVGLIVLLLSRARISFTFDGGNRSADVEDDDTNMEASTRRHEPPRDRENG